MRARRTVTFVLTLAIASSLLAQAPQVFKAQLGIVPLANATGRANIDESSSVFAKANATATLNGTKLTVTGSFEGFKSPASVAQIRTGPAVGVRGPVVFDLTATKETKGTISGTFDLNADQVTLLKSGRLYVQIHNTNTPEGALWGWFLK
jgi:hypothetical protein